MQRLREDSGKADADKPPLRERWGGPDLLRFRNPNRLCTVKVLAFPLHDDFAEAATPV